MITPFVTPSSRSYDLEASLRQSTLLRMDMQGQRIPGCFFTLPIGMQGEANESKPKVNARERSLRYRRWVYICLLYTFELGGIDPPQTMGKIIYLVA